MSNLIRKAAKTAAKASRAPAALGTARSDDAGNSDEDDAERGVFVEFGRDQLRTIVDSATLAGKPVHFRLDVTAFPAEEDDDVTPTSRGPSATPPSTPIKRGLRRRRRMRLRVTRVALAARRAL